MMTEKQLYLLDVDGTICIGNGLIHGAKKFLEEIESLGKEYVFITNNTTRGIDDYRKWFRGLGIETKESNYMTASMITARYIKENMQSDFIYVVGSEAFVKELRKNGINITTDGSDEKITTICVGYDNTITYEKIKNVCRLLMKPDIKYIATNQDLVCPIEFGFVPDCGSFCEMIEHATNRKPIYMGKPSIYMIETALREHGCKREEAVVVGDRLYTDIACGNAADVDTVLVLTGEATREDVLCSDAKPTMIVKSVNELRKMLGNKEITA